MAIAAQSANRVRGSVVLTEGFVSGLIGALSVMIIYYIADLRLAEPFHTPAALQALLFKGPEAVENAAIGVPETFWFTLMNLIAWVVAGTVAALIASVTEAFPKVWYGVMVGVAAVFCAFIWATGITRIEGFDTNHLWIGAIVGSAAMAGYLVWRHPRLLSAPGG